MEVLSSSATSLNIIPKFSALPHKTQCQKSTFFPLTIKYQNITYNSNKNNINHSPISSSFSPNNLFNLPSSYSSSISRVSASTSTPPTSISTSTSGHQRYWMVVMDTPPQKLNSKSEIIDYYVKTLERVLGSEKDAQMCIYDASCDTHFGFCCDIDEETSRELAGLPAVLSVRSDLDFNSVRKDDGYSKVVLSRQSNSLTRSSQLLTSGNSKHWVVRMDKPAIGVVTKAQVVDYYAQTLTKVLRNEKDAQMSMYHMSWQSSFGFCCELDDECAGVLAGVPGVLSIQPDENFESDNKDYGGGNLQQSSNSPDSSVVNQPTNIKTKKLFVTGLSFYTSEKTLRAAFEGFGELVEVRVIMDKISKRSKGYAFVEYSTEEAASAALKEMNGKIINGWMIVVDVAKTNPPKYSRGCPRFV